ncbi:MAG: ribulose-phosphate 3-epimerase, partial [Kiloniellales bacterium]|nr:ribulose-phosphate 3-epimerase [Kiloniellales bacterium]
DASGRAIDLEVDGGINFETAPEAVAAGADLLVAGTATFKGGAGSYADNIARLRGAPS